MKKYHRIFEVANPSPYERSDYVQINLDKLQVPPHLDEKSLTLYRIISDNKKQEIPYQIDYPFGLEAGIRIMTFFSENTPLGKDDYSEKSAPFLIQEGKPNHSPLSKGLWVGHYYSKPKLGEPPDGFNHKWDISREIDGVKLYNRALEVYFKLKPMPLSPKGLSYTGSATSVVMPIVEQHTRIGEMLSPFWISPEKLWGQIYNLDLYTVNDESELSKNIRLTDHEYNLVWSNSGPIRAMITLKSKPITLSYEKNSYKEKTENVEMKASLYRIIYVYPEGKPYYLEDLFILLEKDHHFLNFAPYFFSKVHPQSSIIPTEINRFDHIPDYFSIWKHFGQLYYGYGFATDMHIKEVQTMGEDIYWHLPLNSRFCCIHYFMFEFSSGFDRFHTIGHDGWYEKIFKPLRPLDFSLWFPPFVEK